MHLKPNTVHTKYNIGGNWIKCTSLEYKREDQTGILGYSCIICFYIRKEGSELREV